MAYDYTKKAEIQSVPDPPNPPGAREIELLARSVGDQLRYSETTWKEAAIQFLDNAQEILKAAQ